MEKIAYRVLVEGRVTGVGFRYSALREAERIGSLEGYIRNRDDRTVEAVVQGAPDRVSAMISWLRRGPPSAVVTRCTVTEVPVSSALGPFRITW